VADEPTAAERATEEALLEWMRSCCATFGARTFEEDFAQRLGKQLSVLHDLGLLGTDSELETARSAAVALHNECEVLTEALRLLTHEHDPYETRVDYCRRCSFRVDDPRHRTPAFLGKRYGFGA
jgi:hypothetical protein